MERLEEILEKVYGDSYSACRNNAVSHKAFYFSIKLLKKYGIKFNIVIQEPGEYMIINPGALLFRMFKKNLNSWNFW